MILLVDDKPENLFSLKSTLEQNGFETDTALSGEEALRKVLKQEYALMVLDVQMPGMDGFEVAEAVSGLNKTKDIPIIFLSAVNTHKKFITKGFQSGAVDYLTKPVDPDILILKVRNFYRLYERTHALRNAEKALTETVAGLHAILEALPQLAFTANAAGRLEFVNQHWLRFSASADAFPQTAPGQTPLANQWPALLATGAAIETEVAIQELSTGHYLYHLLRATPTFLAGRLVRWVGTFTNIHEQKLLSEGLERRVAERTRELLEINRELEISNNDLQQFASVASHDLKEPLRKIQVFSNAILEREEVNEGTGRYLQKIVRSSQRMSNLITDLLSFARLSGDTPFEVTNVNKIVDEILFDLELTIEEKAAVINVGPIPQLEAVPGLLRQLFQNLISNSLKFSKRGMPPVITIEAHRIADAYFNQPVTPNGRYCRISVTDNGIGFEEMFAAKIFTIFQRLHAREEYEGTGIGLAIAKKIVDKHNGLIMATATPGQGATFTLILPVRQVPVTAAGSSIAVNP